MKVAHGRDNHKFVVAYKACWPGILGNHVVRRERGHIGPFIVRLSWVAADFDAHLVEVTVIAMGQGDQHVGQARGNANVPQHRAEWALQRIGGAFAKGEVDHGNARSGHGLKDGMTDGTRDHVDDEVGDGVVGLQSVAQVEGRWRFPQDDVVEMDLQPRFDKFSRDKGAHEAAAKAMDSHGRASDGPVTNLPPSTI